MSTTHFLKNGQYYLQVWKQTKINHSLAEEPRTTIFSWLENKASPVTHILQWGAKSNHFQQAWKQSKPSHLLSEEPRIIIFSKFEIMQAHSHPREPRTTIFSSHKNKASPVTHSLKSQEQPFSASLKTMQAHPLTHWRAKDNSFQQLENKASLVTHKLESQGQLFQQPWKQSKPSHSPPRKQRTIFNSLENKTSSVTHQLESQGQPFSAALKTMQAQSLTS